MSQSDFYAAAPSAPAYVPDPRFGGTPVSGAPTRATVVSAAPAAASAASTHRRRSSSLQRTRMIIGSVLALVAVAGYLGFSHLMNTESAAETKTVSTALEAVRDTQIKSDLQRAATSMEAYFAAQAGYPRDLAAAGFTSGTATTIRLVWVNGAGYCLAGGLTGKAPTWWFANQQGGLVQKSC